jgi:DNA-binding transcriptional LysR family regulator
MDLRHLRYLVAAVEEGSLVAAARRVNVAQPALSRQIRDLEEELGCVLLERQARGVQLTSSGAAFHRDALEILHMADMARERARRAGLEQRQRVRVGLVRTASKYDFVQRALADFGRSHPQATIEFSRAASPDLVEGLHEMGLDLGLLFQRRLDPRVFGQHIVHHERYILAMHPAHRLAQRRTIHLSDLAGEPLVWLSRRNNADNHDALLQQCRVQGVEPMLAYAADSHEEQIELVVITSGVCVTVASTQATTPPGQLIYRPIADFHLEVELRLAWPLDATTEPAQALRDAFASAIDEHQSQIARDAFSWTHTDDGVRVARAPEAAQG